MKRLFLALIAIAFVSGGFAQQFKDPNAEVRDVKNFHALKVATGIDLVLVQGNEEAVAVSANAPEYRERIVTKVENGVLKIYFESKGFNYGRKARNLKAYVSAKTIDGIDISSGASVKIEGKLKSASLGLDLSSGAIFKGEIDADKLDVDQSSGSVATVTGSAGTVKIDGSSGSVFHGYGLIIETGNADSSSGGEINITVSKEFTANASSGGAIHYKGNGVIRSVKTSSGGSVSKRS